MGHILATYILTHPCSHRSILDQELGAAAQTQPRTDVDGEPEALQVPQGCARMGSIKIQLLCPKDLG